MIRRVSIPLSLGLLLTGHFALAANGASDPGTVTALDVVGAKLGWSFRLTPPDPITPPDPNTPPDPIKIAVTVDTSVRLDLAHEVTFVRHSDGEGITPCVRLLHQVLAGGAMLEQIDLLGTDDAVRITVPAGRALVRDATGAYNLMPTDILPQ